MEKRRNRPIWGLFAVLLAIVLIGLLCEIVLKAVNATLTMRVRDPRIIVNQVFYGFGNEAVPLWAIPTLVLNWMSVMPRVVTLYGLRWLPLSAQASPWPIFKTFALLMYALILFIVPSRFPKRA